MGVFNSFDDLLDFCCKRTVPERLETSWTDPTRSRGVLRQFDF